MLVTRAITAALAMAAGACTASPDVPNTGSGIDAGQVFADVVLAYGQSTAPDICSDALPLCGDEPPECGPQEVLGAPDTMTFALPAGGFIDLGFRCTPPVERGGEGSPDIRIWSTVPGSADAVVQVSEDGRTYVDWMVLEESNQALDLARIDRTYVRFLRIASRTGSGILIDAVEALTNGSVDPSLLDAGTASDAGLDAAP
ncbi:MAG TPA: hypothetical protein VMZ28_30455 [Kofleriaceae bacterium]|nr:hypothetical protein [Kofleriaceae bacterium]